MFVVVPIGWGVLWALLIHLTSILVNGTCGSLLTRQKQLLYLVTINYLYLLSHDYVPLSLSLFLSLHSSSMLGEWENSCNELQRMLVVRSLRPDRVPQTVTSFVINNLGAK